MIYMKQFSAIGLVVLFWLIPSLASAQTLSDVAKEHRWAEQIEDTLFDGEIVWLDAGSERFLTINMWPEDDTNARSGFLVMHGIGIHPNWEQVIRPLRVGIAEEGWPTLSIQLPILPNEAEPHLYQPLFAEVPVRVEAAISHMRNKGIRDIHIVAHSMGAAMALSYLNHSQTSSVKSAVFIGLNGESQAMPTAVSGALRKLKIPVLDIYGSDDLESVRETAAKRANGLFLAGHPGNKQIEVQGADHFFEGAEDLLQQHILDWINLFH